jgi:hypothetical protein
MFGKISGVLRKAITELQVGRGILDAPFPGGSRVPALPSPYLIQNNLITAFL